VPTHFILSIHLGPCLDQHPACGLVAIVGSDMERGPLVLGLRTWVLWEGERGVAGERGGIYEESDLGSYGLGMDGLRNCQGRGAAHANRFRGLAITISRNVVNLKWIAMHGIQCSCY